MLMRRFARWHIWLGWIAGLPVLMWTLTGLFMVLRPIEDVRGEHLRSDLPQRSLMPGDVVLPTGLLQPAKSLTVTRETYGVITRVELIDGSIGRYDAAGHPLRNFNELAARQLVKDSIVGGDRVAAVTLYPKDKVPLDFRKAMPVWQVALEDGTHVYVGQESGRIEAVRTRWWRAYDFMWGLHILDPQSREDSSNPLLIGLAALSTIAALLGCVLLFRRRRASIAAKGP